MKKFINSQETITDEELVGFGLAYGDIVSVDGHTVISKDLEGADRVTIVTYVDLVMNLLKKALWAMECWIFRLMEISLQHLMER